MDMFNAVSYTSEAKLLWKMSGEEMVGKACPSCGSRLVKRRRNRDDIWFVACDKEFRPYCKFSIGVDETLENRTRRIYNKLSKKGKALPG